MEGFLNTILTIVLMLLVLSTLVFVHELGHFLAAKFFKVYVKEFAIGFGKTVWSKQWGETLYAIRLIPMGGFVELEGETQTEGPNSFRNKRSYQKVIILSAGVFMNFMFAILLFSIFLPSNNYQFSLPAIADYSFNNTSNTLKVFPVTVVSVDEKGNSAGQLFPGDTIVGVGNKRFSNYKEFIDIVKSSQDSEKAFEFVNMDTYETSVRTIKIGKANESGAVLNAGLSYDKELAYPVYLIQYNKSATSAISLTADTGVYLLKALGGLLGNAFKTGNYTEVSQSVGGLPSITNQVSQVVQYRAFDFLIPLAGLISISLAIFNILPFPALDGGQIAVVAIEAVTRKKIPDSILTKINTFGFIFLVGFALIINLKDVIQLGWISSIGDFIKNIFRR